MKVEKLSYNRIKITLTYDEMADYDIDCNEIISNYDLAYDFIDYLINDTDYNLDFLKGDSKLKVEIQKGRDFVLFITKLEVAYEKTMVYKFPCIKDAVMGCKRIDMFFFGTSSLYKYKNNYYLSLRGINNFVSEDCETLMCDYGDKIKHGNEFEGVLAENGEYLIKDKAVTILCNFFDYEYKE